MTADRPSTDEAHDHVVMQSAVSEGILAVDRYDDAFKKRIRRQGWGFAIFILAILATVFAIPFVLRLVTSIYQ